MKIPKMVLALAATALFAGLATPQTKEDVALQSPPGSYDNTDFRFHSVVPLGMESLELLPSHRLVNLLASATSSQFEGMERRPSRGHVVLLSDRGRNVRYFPEQVDFRVSATTEGLGRRPSRGHVVLLSDRGRNVRYFPEQVDFRVSATTEGHGFDPDPLPVETQIAPGEFMLGLHFRLKVFHGLESVYLEPESVEQIGEPADVPASERIYVAHFTLRNLPVTDRILLEVLDPSGQRITRFHLDLL